MLLESAKLRCEKKIRLFELAPKPQTILRICDRETF